MKPMTIEQLKALEVGDWVWVVDIFYNKGMYCRKGKTRKENTSVDGVVYNSMDKAFCMVDYGKTWLAYKNKEQAETDKDKCPEFLRVGNPVYYLWEGRKEAYHITAIEYSPNYGWAFYVDDEDHSRIRW